MSETTNLKLFKHDNPSTNTNPFDVEQSLNENWDKIDTEIGNIRENINGNDTDITDLKSKVTDLETNLDTAQNNIDEIKQEQITQNKVIEANTTAIEENTRSIEQNTTDITKLQEDNAKLKAQIPKGTAAGEEISLSDSAEMELVDFGLQGNSKQATREGYNLLPPFESTVLNGITYTKNADGTITVKGTATDNSFYKQEVSLKAGDYILTGSPDGAENSKYCIQALGYGLGDFGEGQSFKLEQDTIVPIRLMVWSGITVNNLVFKPMLTKGTEKKDYEQYGVSPSLNYSSEVEAVGDIVNLFNKNTTTSGCYVNTNGTLTNITSEDFRASDFIEVKELTDYIYYNTTIETSYAAKGAYYDSNKSFISYFNITNIKATITTPKSCKYIRVSVRGQDIDRFVLGRYELEIVKSNKNILDLGQHSVAGITFNKNKITIKNPTAYAYASNCNLLGNKFLSGKSVTFKFIIDGTLSDYNANYPSVNVNTNKGNYKYQQYIAPNTYKNYVNAITRNFTEDEYITSINVYTTGATCDLTILVQAEINTNTDFIEHKGDEYVLPIQKPFYKLINFGDQSIIYDSFVKQNNKWFEKHNIAKANLENFEWQLGAVQSGTNIITNRWNSTTTLASHSGEIDRFSKCNYLPNVAGGVYNSDKECFGTEYDLVCIRLPKTIATMTTQVKEYFEGLASEGKGAYVIYPLSEPELIECTSEQTQVLEQIVKDGTYKEVTHFYTKEDLKPTIELTYYKDLETLFNKQAELENTLNNVQAQILELGGN